MEKAGKLGPEVQRERNEVDLRRNAGTQQSVQPELQRQAEEQEDILNKHQDEEQEEEEALLLHRSTEGKNIIICVLTFHK